MRKTKLALLIGIFIAVLYFSNDFALIDIEKTAIIVAIGIDKTEQGFEVTSQIAIPKASDSVSSSDDSILSAKGTTVREALQNIAQDTGWQPKLSFCNLIILGKETAKTDAVSIVEYLISSEKVQNSSLVVMADGKASELMHKTTPLDDISSFALKKIILRSEWMTSLVSVTNLKHFAMNNYSKSNATYMPIVTPVKSDDNSSSASGGSSGGSSSGGSSGGSSSGGSSGSGSSGGSSGSSSSQSSGSSSGSSSGGSSNSSSGSSSNSSSGSSGGSSGGSEEIIFDTTTLATFSNGVLTGTLDHDQTQIFSFLQGNVRETFLTASKNDTNYFLSVQKNKHKFSVDIKDKPTINVHVKLWVKLVDSNKGYNLAEPNSRTVVSRELLDELEKKYSQVAVSLNRQLTSTNTDLFGVYDYIYKHYPKRYESFKNVPLSSFKFNQKIEIISED